MKGFYINKIVVSGKEKKSIIEFSQGLNVITGPSNTGKSFLFQCIDYMFGRKTIKEIDELEGYIEIYLEIETNEKQCYTLKRQIKGDKIYVFDGEFENWNDQQVQKKNLKHSPKDNNISSFLLDLMNIPSTIKVLKNQNGIKEALTFRSLSEWFIIDENIMISESELLYGEYKNPTPKQSALQYIIDGYIYNSDNEIENLEVKKARISGKLDVLKINLSNNRMRQVELDKLLNTKNNNISDEKLKQYKVELLKLQTKINSLNNNIIELNKKYGEINESINLKQQQINKFNILKKQYKTDLDRLMFIKENSEKLINMKSSNICPLCGNQIGNEIDESVITSCYAESTNISKNMQELEELNSEIENEKRKLVDKSKELTENISENEKTIKDCYNNIKPLKLCLDEYIKQRQFELELQNLKKNEIQLQEEIDSQEDECEKAKSNKIKPAEKPVTEKRKEFTKFLKEVFCDVDSSIKEIDLTNNLLDITINGRDRRNNGKGYRSFYKSLYFYAMILFKLDDDNYSKILLLDSPLTTFKEGDPINEDIDNTLQYNFIKKLSERSDVQIIIFENKEIPETLKDNVNIIEFTGCKTRGRYGFLE